MEDLYNYVNPRTGKHSPKIAPHIYELIKSNQEARILHLRILSAIYDFGRLWFPALCVLNKGAVLDLVMWWEEWGMLSRINGILHCISMRLSLLSTLVAPQDLVLSSQTLPLRHQYLPSPMISTATQTILSFIPLSHCNFVGLMKNKDT